MRGLVNLRRHTTKTATKLLVAMMAVSAFTLGTAATASADEAGFISSVRSLGYYAVDCPGCAQDAVDVGYRACAAFSRGEQAAVQAVIAAYNGAGQDYAEYNAHIFASYAAHQLCPEHDGKLGSL